MRKIGISIPTWCRYQQTIDSFKQVLDDDRISDIVIIDDASPDGSFYKLHDYFKGNEKVRVIQNATNADCYKNKWISMGLGKTSWGILLDSDNTIGVDYLDAVYAIEHWDEHTIYQPEYSRPHFDFRKHSGLTLTKENVNDYMKTNLETMLNAMNFFINRDEYLRVWDGSIDPITSDSIFFAFTWLKAGNKIHVTPNLQYDHYVDETGKTGHYNENQKRTGNFHKELLEKFKTINGIHSNVE